MTLRDLLRRHPILGVTLLAFVVQALPPPANAAPATWVGTTGLWNNTGNWSPAVLPLGTSDVTISVAGVQTITHGTGTDTINSLAIGTSTDTLVINGGSTLTINTGGSNIGTIQAGGASAGTLNLNGGTFTNTGGILSADVGGLITLNNVNLAGGTLNSTGTGKFTANASGSNFLTGVTLDGNLDLATAAGIERISSGLTLNGAINVNSNSILAFQGDQTIGGTGTITLGSTGANNRITTEAGNLTLGSGIAINGQNGTIGGQSFVAGPATLTNNGTISASVAGGQINLAVAGGGLTTNNGVLSAQNSGNLLLSTAVTNGSGGQINAIGGVVTQNGITITGGTLNTSGGGTFVATNNASNRLAGVTLNGTLDLASSTGLVLATGNLAFGTAGGIVNINSNSALGLEADTVSGNGTITFGSTGANNRLTIEAGDSVIGSGVIVHGQNGTIGGQVFVGGAASLTNNGTISADVAGGTITLGVNGAVTNNGTLSALNGGTLVLNNSINGTAGSSIVVGAGSTLLQNGVTLNGIINSSGTGNFLVSNSAANTLNAVTFSGNLNLASSTSLERALNGLTLTPGSTISINSNSVFALQGETLGGSGTVTFGNTGANNRMTIEAGDSVIGSGVLVHGQNGTIGGQAYAGGAASLTNNGTISADVAGGTISVGINSSAANAVTNNGVFSALNGGTLVLNSNVTGNAGSFITVGAGSRVLQNNVTLTGVINNAGTGEFSVSNNATNTLNGVTFTGPLDLSTSTSLERALNGLTFGTGSTVSINNNSILGFQNEEIGGTAVITFGNTGANNRVTIEAGATVLDAGITIQGQNGTVGTQAYAGGAATLANAGGITANVNGGRIDLNVNGLTTNTGTLAAQNGGLLVLDSAVTNAGSGHIDALGGGTAGSVVLQNGVTITGGTLNTSGAGTIAASSSGNNVLSGVTLAGTLDLASATAEEQIRGGSLVLSSGAININSNSILGLEADTVSGIGTITFGATGSSNRLTVEAGDSVIGSGVTVHGQNGTIGTQVFAGGAATLTNNGVITADAGGGLITLSVNGVTTNNGTLSAQNGSTLLLNSAVTNGGSGHIDAIGTNSVVVQNGVTITGGTLNTSGDGRIAVSNSGSNFLANTTLAGTLDLASGTGQERLQNTTLTLGTGGVININNNSILDLQASTLNGTGTINLGATGASNRIAIEAGSSTIGSGVTIQGQNGTLGNQYFAGGPATLTNNGTIAANVAGGVISLTNASYVNNGTFSATAGVLSANTGFTGTGTALTSGTGQLIVGAASTVGNLINNGTTASALTLGTNNITVSSDYNNANFGVGNSFNRHANVSGTGQILASGNVAQAIAGAGVTNGSAPTASLTIGNVRVGSTTLNYQVANTGTTGPSLRGAIQTNVNGGNITDSQLSVTPGNWGPVAPGGSSANQTITFTQNTAGLLSLASNQVVHVANNFDNVAGQNLNIVLGTGAAAYNLAAGSATPTPVTLGNQHVGGTGSQVLTVTNTAASGSFTEGLNASFGTNGGAATNNGGTVSLLGGQGTSGAMSVGVNTATAGAKNGTVTLNYVSDGTGTSGLGTTGVGSQVITVSGNVYNLAAGSATPTPVTLGNQHVGGTGSQVLTVTNTAASGSFTEGLNASFGTNGGAATNNGGTVSLLGGQGTSGAMGVGVNTATAGAKSGTVTLNYVSDGTGTSGLGTSGVGSQVITVSGNVYNLAAGSATPTPVTLGNQHVGGTGSQVLTVTNTAASGSFTEGLNASFGTNGGAATNNGGTVSLLGGQGTSGAMGVGVNTATAGAKSGTVTLNYVSDGTGTSGLGTTALASQTVNVSGNVYRLASANTLGAVSFGNVHVGDTVQQALNISNTAVADGFSESLNASFGASSDARITTSGSISQLAAGSSNNSSMIVGLNTSAAGTVNGTQTINFASDGTGTSGLGITALASQTIGVSGDITTSGNVYRLASASPATPNPVNFGNVRVGTATDQVLSITNTAAADGFSEKLNASISTNGAPVTASGSFNLLAAQATDSSSLHVGIDTGSAGAKSGSATIALVSDGTGTSGLGTTNLPSQTVTVSGNVYRLANPTLNTPSVTLAARVGDVAPVASVSVTNTSPDVYTEGLKASLGSVPAGFAIAGGSIANLAAQGTDATTLKVGLNTGTSGLFSGSAAVNFTSTGAGTTGAADQTLATQNVTVNGKVYQTAVASLGTNAINFGIVHVGDVVGTKTLSVTNTASAALTDVVTGGFGTVSGPFTGTGSLGSGVAVGGTPGALQVGLNTTTAGVYAGKANLALTSHDPDLADVGIAAGPVDLTATVNNHALPLFDTTGGTFKNFTYNNGIFTLDFGTLTLGAGPRVTDLKVGNGAVGPADLLDGTFDFAGLLDTNIFTVNGFNESTTLTNFNAGDFLSGLSVDFNSAAAGTFTNTIVFNGKGHNASGFTEDLPISLVLKGTVDQSGPAPVPEPGTLVLLGTGSLLLAGIARRRARKQ